MTIKVPLHHGLVRMSFQASTLGRYEVMSTFRHLGQKRHAGYVLSPL